MINQKLPCCDYKYRNTDAIATFSDKLAKVDIEHWDNEKAGRKDCSLVVEIRNNYTVPSGATWTIHS